MKLAAARERKGRSRSRSTEPKSVNGVPSPAASAPPPVAEAVEPGPGRVKEALYEKMSVMLSSQWRGDSHHGSRSASIELWWRTRSITGVDYFDGASLMPTFILADE